MKLLLSVLLVVGIAVAVPLLVGHGSGYVLLVQPPYRIELSTSFFLLAAVLLFVVVHAALRLITYTLHLPEKVRAFKQARREKDATAALTESLSAFAEGRHNKAEKLASHALTLGADPLIATMVGARAAHKIKNYDRRDFYLAEAERLAPDAEVARLLCQAELLLDQRRYQSALSALRQLEKKDAQHLPAMLLEVKIRRQLADWEGTLALATQLEKRGGIEPITAQQWKLQAQIELLARKAVDAELLRSYWQKLPESDRLDNRIALQAAKQFVKLGDAGLAAKIVEMSLTHQWSPELAEYYGECAGPELARQLEQAEFWLKDHHTDSGLLLSLGKLCMQSELWGKAQNYLEASLSIRQTSAAHLALAQMMEKLGKNAEANRRYRQSLECKMAECG